MRETKDWNWQLTRDSLGKYTWEQCHAAILMDIRDELKRMNNILQCPNFIAIPSKLDRISRNTRKPRRPKIVGKPKLRVVSNR
jgi:hypothetical protein